MKKLNLFIFNFCSLTFLEILFAFIAFDSYMKSTIIVSFLYLIFIAIINTIIFSLFN